MRLIDADELIKDRVGNDPVRIAAECATTAFDKGSVLEDLEALEETESLNMNDDVAMAYAYAIAIVEKGGIE